MREVLSSICTVAIGLIMSMVPAAAVAAAPQVVRGPYLQSLLGTSVVVAWRTDLYTLGKVRWTGPDGAATTAGETDASKDHRVVIAGLAPGTAYRYAVLDGDSPLGEEVSFRTAPLPGDGPVKVAVMGDSGSGDENETAVAAVIEAMAPDLLVHTGDFDYLYDPDKALFGPHRKTLARACFYPCMGNDHDPNQDWAALFALPFDGPRGKNEIYYSFDWGDAHFTAIDTELDLKDGSPQRTWAEADLAAARDRKVPWLILYFHRPPYTVGRYGSAAYIMRTVQVRALVAPLVDRFGVNLVLNGHDHNYQRTWPVKGDAAIRTWQEPRYGAPGAAIYLGTGGGGRRLYDETTDADHSLNRLFVKTFHAVQLTISALRIEVGVVSSEGKAIDAFSIEKQDRPYPFIRGDADRSGELDLADAVLILFYLFAAEPLDCPARCKVDGSNDPIAITDVSAILGHLYLDGPPPAAPFPACGSAAGFDETGCSSPACGG